MCLLEDTGDLLLHQQVKNLGIHNDAIGIILILHLMRKGEKLPQIQIWRIYSCIFL